MCICRSARIFIFKIYPYTTSIHMCVRVQFYIIFPFFLPHCFIKEFLAQPLFILKIKEYKFPFIFKKVGWKFITIVYTFFPCVQPKRIFRRNNIQPSCIEIILCNLQIGAVQKIRIYHRFGMGNDYGIHLTIIQGGVSKCAPSFF